MKNKINKNYILLTCYNMKNYNYSKTKFVLSAPNITHLPKDSGLEIAFVGRSNAGKSSALNALTNQKNLAKTSKTPGRTQMINLFEVEEDIRIVDLPGYGFAKVPEQIKIQWQKSLSEYLQKRNALIGIVILMDIRHPLTHLDQQMIAWAVNVNLSILILLTKSDKLSNNEKKLQLNKVREAILPFQGNISVETFSTLKKEGIIQLTETLNDWFSKKKY